MQNIEALEQALANAMRENEQLRRVLDQAPMAIIVRDTQSRFLLVNKGFERLFNITNEACVGRFIEDVMPSPFGAALAEREQEFSQKEQLSTRSHALDLDGRARHFMSFKFPLRDTDGAPAGTTTIAIDTTELKNTEAQLQRTKAQLDSLLMNFPHPVIARDLDGRILLANKAWHALECIEDGTAIGQYSDTILPAHRAEHYAYQDEQVRANGELFEQELTMLYNGQSRSVRFTKFPLLDPDQSMIGIAGTAHDVTELRQVEEQLRQVSKMEAIGQLTSGVAHDFNNLLAVILGRTSLIQRGAGDAKHHGTEISKAAHRGAELIQHMLSFSRRQPLQPKAVDLAQLIDEMLQRLRRAVGANIVLSTNFAGALWPMMTDPTQLESAILNLALNSRDAAPNGGELHISARNVVFTGASLEREHDTTPAIDNPTGLVGEYVAVEVADNGFAKQSGGDAQISSELGKGTSVVVYIPSARSKPASDL